MAFYVARQPLVPAFLTLVAITVAAVLQIDAPAAAAEAATNTILPASLLTYFQTAHPIWSQSIAGFLLLFTGLCLGRISTRYGLYGMNCCLTIPLYGIIACGILPREDYLTVFTASALLALATQNFCRSCRNGYAFDPVFRAAFYLGLIPFVYPPALPVLLALPLAILLFQRTVRELTVALAGAVLPALIICYVAWGCGFDFTAPLVELWQCFITGEPLQFFLSAPPSALAFMGVIILLTLIAIFLFLSNAYSTGSKPRLILTYNISIFLLTAALMAVPTATPGVAALYAIPAALFLPVLFVRIQHTIATFLYLILLAGTLACIFSL